MAFNGSGVYTMPSNDFTDPSVGTDLSVTAWEQLKTDLEAALTLAICKDGQSTTTAAIPFAAGIQVDTINEKTGANGVTIDGVTLKDGAIVTLTDIPTTQATIFAKGSDVASASPLVVGTDGGYFDVTGTTGFSAMIVAAGRPFMLQFDGILTMTDGASLDLGGANITTAAGDRAIFYATAANTVIMLAYFREGGTVDPLAADGDGSGLTGVVTQGPHTIWVPAAAMLPQISNGCASLASTETTAGRPDLTGLDFDDAVEENAQFAVCMPESWNGGVLTFRPVYTHFGGQTGGLDGVRWHLRAVSIANGETADVAYGTSVGVSCDNATAEDIYIGDESPDMTVAGTPAGGEYVSFRVSRNVSHADDDLDIDARLLGIRIHYTVNAGDDA